jgi:hypothetical protein
MLLTYCVSDFEMVTVSPLITGITFAFTLLLLLLLLLFRTQELLCMQPPLSRLQDSVHLVGGVKSPLTLA